MLEKESKTLTITVTKADDLPKWGISGPPGGKTVVEMLHLND